MTQCVNAYFWLDDYIPNYAEFMEGDGRNCAVVFAETRGKAAYQISKEYNIDYIEIKGIRCIGRNIDREIGFAKHDDEYWNKTETIEEIKESREWLSQMYDKANSVFEEIENELPDKIIEMQNDNWNNLTVEEKKNKIRNVITQYSMKFLLNLEND